MRVWDVPPKDLCRKHLLGEHRELHAVWVILTKGKRGYSQHPETKRWLDKLKALYTRHDLQVKELLRRGYRHFSPLDKCLARGRAKQNKYINSLAEQHQLLRNKPCSCYVSHRK